MPTPWPQPRPLNAKVGVAAGGSAGARAGARPGIARAAETVRRANAGRTIVTPGEPTGPAWRPLLSLRILHRRVSLRRRPVRSHAAPAFVFVHGRHRRHRSPEVSRPETRRARRHGRDLPRDR